MPRALSCTIQSTGGHFSQSILLSLAEHMKPMGSRHHRQVTAIEAGTHPQASGHSPTGSPSLRKHGLDPMVDPTDTLHVSRALLVSSYSGQALQLFRKDAEREAHGQQGAAARPSSQPQSP